MVGGLAATDLEKSNERSTGGAWRKAGKRANIVKRWACENAIILVGWR